MNIFKFFKNRKEARDRKNYENGYKWAKTQISIGKSKEFIEGYTFNSVDMFDLGAQTYIREKYK